MGLGEIEGFLRITDADGAWRGMGAPTLSNFLSKSETKYPTAAL